MAHPCATGFAPVLVGRRGCEAASGSATTQRPTPAMILYLIRHGESTYNATGRIQGQSDVPLSELGRRQAQAMADSLAREPIEAIYASPLRRASETADFLAAALGLPVRYDPLLKEVHAGAFEARVRDEILAEYPGTIAHWRSGRLDFAFPGGESRVDVIRRGRESFTAVCRAGHGHVAIVAHGGLLLAGLKELLGLHSTEPPHDMANASITRLSVNGHGTAELLDFDNTDHLTTAGLGRTNGEGLSEPMPNREGEAPAEPPPR
ncbi:MAG: histidine phosphatase family protein [Pirellulales bacterium]|nr:histidine phosphatase family protein [Pirellulales bacterium]